MKEKFLSLYTEVFDENKNIKACGRDTCKKLIEAAKRLDNKTDYGSINTGFINVNEMHELYNHESKK